MSGSLRRMPVGPDVTKRPVLASYDDYGAAQKAVDTLSDKGFPVQNVAIVGVDLRIVESVMGRLSWGRAAVSGLFTGAWFGLLIGLFVGFFSSTAGSAFPLMMFGLLYGAAFGIIFGLISYAFTRGRRDFVSRQQLQATRYDVLCAQEVIGQARQMLGLTWPPPAPAPQAEAGAPADSGSPADPTPGSDDVPPGGQA